jgi:hypothetical protein
MVKVKVNLVPVHAMKAYKTAEVQLYSFVTSELGGREWSTSHPNHFILGGEPRYPFNMRKVGPQSPFLAPTTIHPVAILTVLTGTHRNLSSIITAHMFGILHNYDYRHALRICNSAFPLQKWLHE